MSDEPSDDWEDAEGTDNPPTDASEPTDRPEAVNADTDESAETPIPVGDSGSSDSSDTSNGSDTPGGGRSDVIPGLRKRLVVGIAIVLTVLVLAAIAGAIVPPSPPTQSLADAPDPDEPPEPFVTDVRVDRIEADGEVSVSEDLTVGGGHTEQTVLIEETGTFEQDDIRPFISATTMAGHEIRFHESGNLSESLEDADTYVLIDPRRGFDEEEVDAITEFTDRGGRLILLGNPDRVEISTVGLGASLQTVRTDMRVVASEYGIVFGNRYLYDTANSDASYRQVFGEPTAETGSAAPRLETGRVVLSTATRVETRDGTVLLRTPETTKLSDGGQADTYPVAVADENVLAVGNTAFLAEGRHNVADNEELVAYMVEFAISER